MKTSVLGSTIVALTATLSLGAQAQPFPSQQPIQIVVPFAAGGAVDSMSRTFARSLSSRMQQSAVVINKEGAGGTIGFWQVVRASANGYTLAYGPSTPVTAGNMLSNGPKYDQLIPVCQTHENIMTVVVRAESPIKTLQQLITMAKEQPGKVAYGHAGQGTVPHLSMEDFARSSSISFNAVAYRGDSPMLVDLMGGNVDFGVSSAAAANSDKLRVLGVFAEQRVPTWPSAPAMREFGTASLAPGLVGLWAPKDTPPAVVSALEKQCEGIVRTDEFQQAASALSQRPAFLGSEAFKRRVSNDFVALEKTIRALNLK